MSEHKLEFLRERFDAAIDATRSLRDALSPTSGLFRQGPFYKGHDQALFASLWMELFEIHAKLLCANSVFYYALQEEEPKE